VKHHAPRVLPLLLLAACTRDPGEPRNHLAEMNIVCTAYEHAVRVSGADTITGELQQWHRQAERVCENAENRSLQRP
jgi:hypothetical protein